MIDVSPEQLKIVSGILAQFVPECEVRVFGSRVNGNPKPYSDLDLAVIGQEKIPIRLLGQLREAFEACELPFRVDVLDWNAIPESFRNIIQQNYEVIQKQKNEDKVLSLDGAKMGRPLSKGYKIFKWGLIVLLMIFAIFVIRHIMGMDDPSDAAIYKIRKQQLQQLHKELIFQGTPDLHKLYESSADSIFISPFKTTPSKMDKTPSGFENFCDYYVAKGSDGKWTLYEKSSSLTKGYRLSINSDGIVTKYGPQGEIISREDTNVYLPGSSRTMQK